MFGQSISFDGYSLQTATIITGFTDHESSAAKNAQVYTLAHANASVIPYVSYPSKQITVTGMVIGSDIATLDQALDTFRSYFIGTARNLDIGYAGGVRRYTATLNQSTIGRPGGLLYAPFQLTFIATNPFGTDITNTVAINSTANTAVPYLPTYTFSGSAPTQRPVITVTFSAMTGNTTAQSVTVSNNATSQGITVNRLWGATDVLVIDCFNKTVTINGNNVVFTGAFPEFPPKASTIGYNDGLTTRTFAFNMTYKVAYF